MTLEEVAAVVGGDRESVRRIESQALRKLRGRVARPLRQYVEDVGQRERWWRRGRDGNGNRWVLRAPTMDGGR